MQGLGKTLRERAAALGLSDSEVARRVGLSQARYHNYVSDTAEPDLGTLMRICRTLATSPDQILHFARPDEASTGDELHRARLVSAASSLTGDVLAYAADLVEAVMAVRRKRLKTEPVGDAAPRSRKPTVLATEPVESADKVKAGRSLASKRKR